MTEITRVPLQPVAKGSVAKIWIGVAIAVVVAILIAWAARYQGLLFETLKAGEGPSPTADDVVLINYVGHLKDGTEFDRGEQVPLPVSGSIKGFSKGLQRMQKDGSYRLTIPANMAYGDKEQRNAAGKVVIPANSDLVFDVDLLGFMNGQQYQAMQQMQMQMQQGGAGGAPGQQPGGAEQAPPRP